METRFLNHESGISGTVRSFTGHLPYFCILILVNFFIYHDYWFSNKIFTGKDFLTSFYPLLNFQTDCLQEKSWPLWNPFMNFGYPFVGHYINTAFFPTHLIMGLVTGSTLTIVHWELLLWIIIGGLGIYLCVLELEASRLAGVICGVSFMFCGQLIPLPQWSLLVYNASCFPYLLLGYHRAMRLNEPLNLVSIAFLSMTIFGGYIVATVLGIYIFIGYVLIDSLINKRFFFGVKYLSLTLVVSVLITLPKLVPLYNGMGTGPRMTSPESALSGAPKDTFNLINSYNFMSLLIPVKYYFSLYIGELSIIALIYGITKKVIRVNTLFLMSIFSAWFLMVDKQGDVSLLRSLSYFLPLMKLVRNEWLYWFYPSIFAILYISKYIDGFLSDENVRPRLISVGIFFVLLSAIFFYGYNVSIYYRAYLTHIVLAVLWFSVTFLNRRKRLMTVFSALLIAAEFFIVFSRVNIDEPPVREGDNIRIAVVDQASVSRSFMDDNRARYKFYASAMQDHLRPSIDQSRHWPYLISGLGGDLTYNMSPEQYGRFIDYMNLKRFTGWWYNTQERFDFIRIKDSALLAQMENQPLFVLFNQTTGEPMDSVSFDRISCSDFTFTAKTKQPGFLLLHQIFDKRWNLYIDKKEQPLLLANNFFMGLNIEPGEHVVEFVFRDKNFTVSVIVSIITLAGTLIVVMFKKLRRRGILSDEAGNYV